MRLIYSIVISFIVFSLCGCKRSLQDLIADTKEATVTIYTFDEYGSPQGKGSGFFIDSNGTGITNYHVLDGATKATLKTNDGIEYEIDSVVASSRKRDIIKFTVKKPDSKKFQYLTFAKETPVQGDRIYNISAPMGLEQTFSEGAVSALRSDSHGDVLQITAPISPGSSGSAILNEKGEVIAVATYLMKGGQNLNFGVRLDEDLLTLITENDFAKRNAKFNSKDNFVIVNTPSTGTPYIRLNAIEFKKDATVAYFSYTNLDMTTPMIAPYLEVDKKDDGFYLMDNAGGKKYYITSSTLGSTKEDATPIPLATTRQFKVFFPAVPNFEDIADITLVQGKDARGWRFENIDVARYRESLNYDMDSYQKNYAYSLMHEGDLDTPFAIFSEILEENPEDEDALNVLGIISYVQGNKKNALDFFTEAINTHESSETGYSNRAYLYLDDGETDKGLADLKKSIELNPSGENYLKRAGVYLSQEKWSEAKKDLDKTLALPKFKEDASIIALHAICEMQLGNRQQAIDDFQRAYKLTNDPELERQIEYYYELL